MPGGVEVPGDVEAQGDVEGTGTSKIAGNNDDLWAVDTTGEKRDFEVLRDVGPVYVEKAGDVEVHLDEKHPPVVQQGSTENREDEKEVKSRRSLERTKNRMNMNKEQTDVKNLMKDKDEKRTVHQASSHVQFVAKVRV